MKTFAFTQGTVRRHATRPVYFQILLFAAGLNVFTIDAAYADTLRVIRIEPRYRWQPPIVPGNITYDSPEAAYQAFRTYMIAENAAHPTNESWVPIAYHPLDQPIMMNDKPASYTFTVQWTRISPPAQWVQDNTLSMSVLKICPNGWSTPSVFLGGGISYQWCEKQISQAEPPPNCDDCPAVKQPAEDSYGVGNPIYPESGVKVQRELDYVSANGLLRFERTYRSDSGRFSSPATAALVDVKQGPPTPAGCILATYIHSLESGNHCFNYYTPPASVLSSFNANALFVHDSSGHITAYDQTSGTPVPNKNINDRAVKFTDGQGAVTWRVYRANNSIDVYAADGRRLSATTADGKTVTYGYTNGQVTSMADSFGRSLQLEYSGPGGQLSRMLDPAGEQYNYSYEVGGTLCPGPLCGKLKSVQYPNLFERSYYWNESANTSGASLPNSLTGVSEFYPATASSQARTVRSGTYTYDSSGFAMSTQGANGVNHYAVTSRTIWNGTAVASDPLNTSRTYRWTQLFGATYRTRIDQPAGAGSSASSAFRTYDVNANLSSRDDFNAKRTCYAYDLTRNLETTRVEGLANTTSCGSVTTPNATLPTGSRKISTQWHPDWRLATKRAEPRLLTTRIYNGQPDPFNGNGIASCAPTLALLPDGKPIAVLCKSVQQATTDTDGHFGFSATLDSAVPNRQTTWAYNEYGQVLTVDGPRTDVTDTTTYVYYTSTTTDYTQGDLQQITNAAGHVTEFPLYNKHGQVLRRIDPNGLVTNYTYDTRQRMTSIDVGGELTAYGYDASGQLTSVTLPDNSGLTFTYDDAHRLTATADFEGNRISYTLDAIGNRTAEQVYDPSNALTQTRSRVFDALNRLWKEIGAAGTAAVTTEFAYDKNGNQTNINAPLSRNTVQAYDSLNRLKQVTDPLSGVTQYGYDALDQLISVTDPRSKVTSYTYNALGDLTQLVSPDTGTTTNTYDSGGNLSTSTDARSKTGTYTYDALNRVTSVTYPDQTISYTYDSGTNQKGRLTQVSDASGSISWSYDTHGRVLSRQQSMGVTKTLGYAYDSFGRLQTLTLPSGNTIAYGYTDGKITSLTLNGSTTLLSNVLYQPFGPTQGWTWGNSTLAVREYDTDGKVTDIDSAGLKTYSYDDAFRITGITDAANSSLSQSYGYDLLDRLTSATATSLNQGWTYDANGNRLTQTGSAASTYTVSSTSNRLSSISGALSRTYSYDNSGNTTADGSATFTYNDAGRMVSATKAGVTAAYALNALGQRVKKTTSGSSRYFAYDEAGHLVGEYDNAGDLIQETVWLGDIPVATLRPNGAGVDLFYIHTDHLNTPRRISRPSDNVIVWRWDSDPFGTTAAAEDPDADSNLFVYNLRFPGQYFDGETALHYNYFRDYDPSTGRYTQSDLVGLAGGLNTYAYGESAPLFLVDPFGLASLDPTKEIRDIMRKNGRGSTDTCTMKIVQATLAADMGELTLALVECSDLPLPDIQRIKDACEIQRTPIQKLLEGTGKLKDLRSNPNLRGVDIESILRGTPKDLRELGLTDRQLGPIKKALQEARDLGGRRGGGS